jgi:hypothetical protein
MLRRAGVWQEKSPERLHAPGFPDFSLRLDHQKKS